MKQIIQHTWAVLTAQERSRFVRLTLAGIIISVADILSLVTLLWIIQFYIQPGTPPVPFLPGWLANKDSVALIAFFLVFFALKNSAAYLIAKAHYSFTGRVAIRISCNSLVSYQQSSFAAFVNTDSSALIRRIALQPFEFAQHVLSGLQQMITQFFLIALAILAILLFNAKLFLLLLLVLLPPVVLVFYFIKKRMAVAKKNLRENNERSYQYLLDALKGYVEANVYQRNSFFLRRFQQYREKFSRYLFGSLSLQNLPGRVIEIFAVLGLFVLIVIVKWTDGDSYTLITIGAFMAAAYKIIPGIVKVINLAGQMKAYEFSAAELETYKDDPIEKKETLPAEAVHSVSFTKVSFEYAGLTILKELSFAVKKGEMLGISGISGKGKTTILNLLLGFLQPASGIISINDQSLSAGELKQYRPVLSYVRQQSFFIYDTILRNITLEEREHDKDRLSFALKMSGLDKLAEMFPEGLEKIITENGKNISGGQQQRIAIARALYKNADLILLDEPFNELDEASVFLLLQQFRQMALDKIIILITHDSKSLSFCDKTISLDEQP